MRNTADVRDLKRGLAINRTLSAQIGSGEAENTLVERRASPAQHRVRCMSVCDRGIAPESVEGRRRAQELSGDGTRRTSTAA